MQIILENKDEGGNSRETSSIDSLICKERISRCVEGEYTGELGDRRNRI